MTLKQVIDMVDAIKPNAFDEATKTMWINEVEGYVQTEVFLLAVEDVVQYAWPTDKETTLLVEPPHSKLYWTYLSAMVDFSNGEYNKYNNTMQLYNAFMGEYERWYAKRYRPADGRCIEHGYYISAYGIAVKHGYTGTEEEWLASLKGNQGDKGDPGEGITYVEYNADGTMTVYYGDGESATSPNLKGEQGIQGPQGEQGIQGEQGEQGIQGIQGVPGQDGADGDDGVTFTPSVDASGNISWTNDGGRQNPPTQNIKGPQGIPGQNGADGADGNDGVSPSVSVTAIAGGHRVTITDAQGTRYFDVMDGSGSGDMTAAVYDPDGAVAGAGGISEYVEENGGKIDTIKRNGTALPITNKSVNISVPTELSELNSDATHRTVTDTEKSTWNGKQSAISDLDTIRSGAALGATAVQPTRKINGKALSADVMLNASDVSADASGTASSAVNTHNSFSLAHSLLFAGKQNNHKKATVTLSAKGWTNNSKTVSVTGVTSSNTVIVAPTPESMAAWGDCGIKCTAQAEGTLTFTRETASEIPVTVNVVILD